MTWTGEEPLTREFTALGLLLDDVTAVPASAFTREQIEAAVQEFYRLTHRVEAAKLHLLRLLDQATPNAGDAKAFLTTHPRNVDPAQASRDVDAARMSDPSVVWDGRIGGTVGDRGVLQGLGAALARGEVSRAHLDGAVRAVASIPTQLRRGSIVVHATQPDGSETRHEVPRARLIDGLLTEQACEHAPTTTKLLTEELLAVLDPDRADRGHDPEAHTRRTLTWTRLVGGMRRMTADLDEASYLELHQAVTACSAPDPTILTEDGEKVEDTRSRGQRELDGLLDLARRGIGASTPAIQDKATVLVHVTPEHLLAHGHPLAATTPTSPTATGATPAPPTDGVDPVDAAAVVAAADQPGESRSPALAGPVVDGHGPISTHTLTDLACDSRLRSILMSLDGNVLALGHADRLATPDQRAALAARDGSCIAPGCTTAAWACHAHHVIFARDGGPTTLRNLVLLCPRHHRALHAGHLDIRYRENGIPQSRWTSHTGPPGPWVHNRFPDDLRTTRRVARQLRAEFDQPPDVSDPWTD